MSHVFISYSRQDNAYARKLAEHLLSLGFDVWIDDHIDFGDDWWRAINRALKSCGAVIVIMTPASDRSRWVQREITLADELGIQTYPLLLEGELLNSEHWTIFVRTQYIDVRSGELPSDDFYARLTQNATRRSTRGIEVTDKTRLDSLPEVGALLPPPFDWCAVEAGSVTLSDAREYGGTRGGRFYVEKFHMARYPITNAQYQAFVEAMDGYRNVDWWAFSDDALVWRKHSPVPMITGFPGNDLPRTNITWYEAMAFCNWLTAQMRAQAANPLAAELVITLPTEQQWQRAALGDSFYFYPWGISFDRLLCNVEESGINQPTPVTRYLGGASPFDVLDMVGNVWEWCLNHWGDDSTDLKATGERAVRGGSWADSTDMARVLARDGYHMTQSLNCLGFRVACVPMAAR